MTSAIVLKNSDLWTYITSFQDGKKYTDWGTDIVSMIKSQHIEMIKLKFNNHNANNAYGQKAVNLSVAYEIAISNTNIDHRITIDILNCLFNDTFISLELHSNRLWVLLTKNNIHIDIIEWFWIHRHKLNLKLISNIKTRNTYLHETLIGAKHKDTEDVTKRIDMMVDIFDLRKTYTPGIPITPNTMDSACLSGNIHLVRHMYENWSAKPNGVAFSCALSSKNIELLDYLNSIYPSNEFTEPSMILETIRCHDIKLLNWVLIHRRECRTLKMLNIAIRKSSLHEDGFGLVVLQHYLDDILATQTD